MCVSGAGFTWHLSGHGSPKTLVNIEKFRFLPTIVNPVLLFATLQFSHGVAVRSSVVCPETGTQITINYRSHVVQEISRFVHSLISDFASSDLYCPISSPAWLPVTTAVSLLYLCVFDFCLFVCLRIPHISEIMRYFSLCVWLISLTVMFSSFQCSKWWDLLN